MIIISADFWFSIAYDQKKKKKALKKYCEDDFNVRFAYLNFFFFLCRVVQHLASKYFDTFESLELDGNELSDNTIFFVSFCHRLKTLSVSFCERLTDLSVKYLLVRQRPPSMSDISLVRRFYLWCWYNSQTNPSGGNPIVLKSVVVSVSPISGGDTVVDPVFCCNGGLAFSSLGNIWGECLTSHSLRYSVFLSGHQLAHSISTL